MNREEMRAAVNEQLKGDYLQSPSEPEKAVDGLSTGSVALNAALSGNPFVGFQWGTIAEIYGTEQSGKTTLTLSTLAELQRLEELTGQELPALFVDAEHALDVHYAKALGVDLKKLDIFQPDYGEQGFDLIESCLDNGYRFFVVDSVDAMTPKAEIEGSMEDSHMGAAGKMMSRSLRRLSKKIAKKKAILLFTNQIRMKVGMVFGNPEDTPGGKALKFYAIYRMELRAPRGAKKTIGALEVGTQVKVKVVKNKRFPPYQEASLPVVYGEGIDRYEDCVTYAEELGLLGEIEVDGKTYKSKAALLRVLREKNAGQLVVDVINKHFEDES